MVRKLVPGAVFSGTFTVSDEVNGPGIVATATAAGKVTKLKEQTTNKAVRDFFTDERRIVALFTGPTFGIEIGYAKFGDPRGVRPRQCSDMSEWSFFLSSSLMVYTFLMTGHGIRICQ
jgi:hypothetical protein